MATKNFRKILIGLCFAVAFGLIASVLSVQAGDISLAPSTEDCQSCHGLVYESWTEGGHGESEIPCTICHNPVPEGHPSDGVMPTDVSSKLCGTCHTTVYEEWSESLHGKMDLTCVRCHNSHTTHLKTESVQSLCENCHADLVHIFPDSAHASAGLLCTDCHLREMESADRVGPGTHEHSFHASLATCASCHEGDMHSAKPHEVDPCDPEEIAKAAERGEEYPCDATEIAQAGMAIPLEKDVLASEPQAVSPTGFAIVRTMVGMAAGIILSPWIEKLLRRNRI